MDNPSFSIDLRIPTTSSQETSIYLGELEYFESGHLGMISLQLTMVPVGPQGWVVKITTQIKCRARSVALPKETMQQTLATGGCPPNKVPCIHWCM